MKLTSRPCLSFLWWTCSAHHSLPCQVLIQHSSQAHVCCRCQTALPRDVWCARLLVPLTLCLCSRSSCNGAVSVFPFLLSTFCERTLSHKKKQSTVERWRVISITRNRRELHSLKLRYRNTQKTKAQPARTRNYGKYSSASELSLSVAPCSAIGWHMLRTAPRAHLPPAQQMDLRPHCDRQPS